MTGALVPVGERGRVRTAQGQLRCSLLIAGAYVAAAPISALVPHSTGWWLPLHLFLVGGLLSAVSGATQYFAVTWAAGPPPTGRAAWVQRSLIAGGALILAVGRELKLPTVVATTGGLSIVTGLLALAVLLIHIVKPAVQRRFDPAIRFYLVAILAGGLGCGVGMTLLLSPDLGHHDRFLSAHVTLNLLGLVGLVIVGTLPFFSATEARTRMSSRATVRAQAVLLGWFALALAAATLGLLDGSSSLAATGLGGYALGLGFLVTMLPTIRKKQLRWAGPRLVQLGVGVVWWAAGVAFASVRAADGRPPFDHSVLALIAVGGYAQILVGSLAYLGPVLRGGGHERLSAGFNSTRSWAGLAVANIGVIGLASGRTAVATAALAAWATGAAWRLRRVMRSAQLPTPTAVHDVDVTSPVAAQAFLMTPQLSPPNASNHRSAGRLGYARWRATRRTRPTPTRWTRWRSRATTRPRRRG